MLHSRLRLKREKKIEMSLLVSPECLHMFKSLETKSYFSQAFHNHSRQEIYYLSKMDTSFFQTWFRDFDKLHVFETLTINRNV